MGPDPYAPPPLHRIFDGARCFGLGDDEIWRAVEETLYAALDEATVAEWLDGLTGALALRILSKQRRVA
jgi:hypothetical protein